MKERALADAMASSSEKPTRLPSCNVRLKNCRPWQLYPVKSGNSPQSARLMNAAQLIDAVDGAMTELDGTDTVSATYARPVY